MFIILLQNRAHLYFSKCHKSIFMSFMQLMYSFLLHTGGDTTKEFGPTSSSSIMWRFFLQINHSLFCDSYSGLCITVSVLSIAEYGKSRAPLSGAVAFKISYILLNTCSYLTYVPRSYPRMVSGFFHCHSFCVVSKD